MRTREEVFERLKRIQYSVYPGRDNEITEFCDWLFDAAPEAPDKVSFWPPPQPIDTFERELWSDEYNRVIGKLPVGFVSTAEAKSYADSKLAAYRAAFGPKP